MKASLLLAAYVIGADCAAELPVGEHLIVPLTMMSISKISEKNKSRGLEVSPQVRGVEVTPRIQEFEISPRIALRNAITDVFKLEREVVRLERAKVVIEDEWDAMVSEPESSRELLNDSIEKYEQAEDLIDIMIDNYTQTSKGLIAQINQMSQSATSRGIYVPQIEHSARAALPELSLEDLDNLVDKWENVATESVKKMIDEISTRLSEPKSNDKDISGLEKDLEKLIILSNPDKCLHLLYIIFKAALSELSSEESDEEFDLPLGRLILHET